MAKGKKRLLELLGDEEEEQDGKKGKKGTQGAVTVDPDWRKNESATADPNWRRSDEGKPSGKERLKRLMESDDDTPANRESKMAAYELAETGSTNYRGKAYNLPAGTLPNRQKRLNAATAGASQDVAKLAELALGTAKERDDDWWQQRRNERSARASQDVARMSRDILEEKKEQEPRSRLRLPEIPKRDNGLNPGIDAEFQRKNGAQGPNVAPGAWAQSQIAEANRRDRQRDRYFDQTESGWKNVGTTLGGMAAKGISELGGAPLIAMARIMEMPDDQLYRITGNEQFNLDREPGLRNSAALRASDPFAEEAERAYSQVGDLGKQLIQTAGAAGSMIGWSGFLGPAFQALGNAGTLARLSNVAESSPLLTSAASRRGAKIALDVLTNPGNFGISLGSAVNSYDKAYAEGANFEQAVANGIYNGLAEYMSNKLFSGTPLEDNPGEKGYVTRLVESITKDTPLEKVLVAFNKSTGGKLFNWAMDKAGEGLEEVITGIADPLIEKLTYNWSADLATAKDLVDEFAGGVLLSLLMSGGEATINRIIENGAVEKSRVVKELVAMGVDRATANRYAKQITDASSAVLDGSGWLNGEYNDKARELMGNADYAEKSQGKQETADKAAGTDSESLNRYAEIYYRENAVDELRRGAEPASVSEAAYLNELEARNYFYIWESQGPKAADAYYDSTVRAAVQNRQARAEAEYQARRQAEQATQDAQENAQERPAPPVPSGMQQATETRTETATEPVQAGPPLPSRMTREQQSRAETPASRESAQGASEAAQETPTERKRPSAKQQSLAQQRQRQTETQAENLRERGFTTAGEDTVAHVRSEDTWDTEEKAVAAALREQGIEPTFVTGLLKNAEGKRTTAILEGNRLAIQADNRSQTVQSIAEKALGKTLNVDPAAFGSAAEAAITARTETKSKPAKTVSQRAQATLDSARQYGVSDEDANTAARLADVLGKDIRFYSKPGSDSGWENGYTEDGVIYVNAAAKARTVTWVIGHELTHNTEHARIYQALQKLAKQYYGSQWQNRIDSRVAAGERMAKAKGDNGYLLSPEAAAQELTADYFAEKVLTDEATIRQIVKNDAPTARRIVSYLKNLLQKLKGKEPTIERAIDLYSRALKQAAQEAQEKGRKNSLTLPSREQYQQQTGGLTLPSRQQTAAGKQKTESRLELPSRKQYSAEDSEYERELGSRSLLATPALKKLGVKVSGSVGQYGKTESLIAKDRAAKSLQREARKAEKRLKATDAEKEFANGIAAGIYSEEDIPKRMNKDTVMELADYYFAENSANLETLHQLRSDINQGLRDEAQELLEDADIKPQSMLLLNERTPERSFRAMFGDRAEEITKWMLDPVRENEAEKIRWYNKQMDAVRKFKDSKGKTRELTRAESALTMRVMEGRAAADMVAAMETRAAIENAAHNIRNGEDPGDAAMEFSLSAGERDLAEKYAGWLSVQEELKTADSTIVEAAAEKYAQIFDDYYDAINDFLAAHGYEPIGYIKGYAPHMQPEENQSLLQKAFASLGINEEVSQLPASIAGMTTFFKPNKRWNPYFLQRTGDTAEYDIVKAYQSYVDYMADILYHTDDVMRIRQTANWIRKTYAPEEIRANLDWAQELRNASTEEKQRLLRDAGEIGQNTVLSPVDTAKAMQDYIDKLYQQIADSSKNSNLVMWLDNYANILAGKQSFADRGWEYSTGRKSLNWANRLNNVFQKANVAGNLSSILNQTAQLPMIYAELGERDFLGAMADIVSGKTKSWAQDSDFLTAKEGKDLLYTDNADKFISALFAPAGFTDNLVSTIAVRGAFKKAIREGMSYSEAMAAADKFGQAVMGSRAKGSRPLAYESKGFFSKMVHMFQIEAVNSWDHLATDLPYEIRQIAKTDGKDKAARALAALVIRALLGAFVLNRLTDELYGGTPAPFDVLGLTANFVASGQGLSTNQYIRTIIDNTLEKMGAERIFETEKKTKEDFDLDAAAEELIYNVMNDIPLIRNAAGVMGLGDQTVPLPGAGGEFKNLATTAKALLKDGREEGEVANLIKAAILAGLQFVPGGRQLSKTAQGAEALIRGGSYSGYKNPKLQYPLEGAADTAKALLFGKNATGAAQDYWAAGGKALTEKQTALYQSMVDEGMSRREAFETITGHRTEGTLDDYVKWTESRSRDAGIGEDLYLRFRADTKDITGDPDGKGGTVSGSKKAKVVEYIDGLKDLTPDQKTAMLLDYNSTYSLKDLPWLEGAPAEPQETKPVAEPGSSVAAEPNKPAPTEPEKVTKMRGTLTELGLQDSKVDALAPVLGGDGSNTSKWRAVANQNLGKDQQDAVLKSIMTDAMYRNWTIASGENISLDDYVTGREAYVDLDNSGTDQNGEWTAALEQVTFDKDTARDNYIKGILWQIYTGSTSTKNNPFDKAAGQKVLDAKNSGGGKSGGDKARIQLPTQKQPWEMRSKPSSGLRIRSAIPAAQAPRSGLRIRAK